MYKVFVRPLLFLIDPETVHHLTFSFFRTCLRIPGIGAVVRSLYDVRHPSLERVVAGLRFPNPVGLAAGFDKDASLVDELAHLGFGFVEIGTLTPKPQPGNDKPRLFRLPLDNAIINRMGFNNGGAAAAAERLRKRKTNILIGGNIGKNKSTPQEMATADYLSCIETLHAHVDYFVVNVSSPNTPGLRALQDREPLMALLTEVKRKVSSLQPLRPVFLKIAPDLTDAQLDDVVDILKQTQTDGVIATNTTIQRDGLYTSSEVVTACGAGGLSGKPLTKRANEVVRYLRQRLPAGYPIIGVGGIMSEADALERLNAGADLVQLYTGFIYEGPAIISRINGSLLR